MAGEVGHFGVHSAVAPQHADEVRAPRLALQAQQAFEQRVTTVVQADVVERR